MSLNGHTFSIKRMQTHDGPGLRTTVFMKGCSLRCAWCHNPESLSMKQELWRDDSRCIGCAACAMSDGQLTGHANWSGDVSVVEQCPAKALELLRRDWDVEGLVQEISKDAAFLENGGVTVSGGEPAVQWPFVADLLQRCQRRGWHTALDTCGAVSQEAFDALLPHCDLVLYDLKIMDADEHRRWTGQSNDQVFDNLCCTGDWVRQSDGTLWIRTPLIPEATAYEENIAALGQFLHEKLPGVVQRWELCAFNNLCQMKYDRLEKAWYFAETSGLTQTDGDRLLEVAKSVHPAATLKGRFR